MSTPDKRNWKIIYSNYTGMEKKAIDLVYSELGSCILRDEGQYAIHVLACEKANDAVIDKNAVIIGIYEDNALIRSYINKDEIPEDGYVVKVCNAQENEDLKIAIITAKNQKEVFYGAVDFVDDYISNATIDDSGIYLTNRLLDPALGPFRDYYNASSPSVKRRTIFAWGHPINDYRDYIDNMARLRLNQLVLWNDFVPINAKDFIDYAHEYGIQVVWGYSWGWKTKCWTFDPDTIPEVQKRAIETYEKQYAPLGVDGIYFQSFTENTGATLKGKLVADLVSEFVNETADIILKKNPDLYIIFGLHAKSVKDNLSFIEKIDPRIEIMWEDCGAFPYSYIPKVPDEKSYNETLDFTDMIVSLRGVAPTALLIRGVATMSWISFVHQSGPYILGNSAKQVINHDKALMKKIWRPLQAKWLAGGGRYAHDMIKHIVSLGRPDVAIGMAGQFTGGIWLNEAIISEILWNCNKPYEEILERVAKRRCIEEV